MYGLALKNEPPFGWVVYSSNGSIGCLKSPQDGVACSACLLSLGRCGGEGGNLEINDLAETNRGLPHKDKQEEEDGY